MRALALVLLLGVAQAQSPSTLTPPPPPPPPPPDLPVPPPPPPAPEATPAPGAAHPERSEALSPAKGRAESKETPAAPPASPAPTPSSPSSPGHEDPLLGIMADLGFPDGLGASLVYRPIWFTRLYGGPTYNFIAPGLRLGATLVPFHFAVTPTLSAEYGHAFDGDAGRLVSRFGTLDPAEKVALEKVGYDYLSIQLGIETGSPRTFAWFLRLGVAWLFVGAHHFDQAAQIKDPRLTSANPRIRAAVPTLSTGVYLFVW